MNLKSYAKAIVAAIGAAASVATALGLNQPWVPVLIAVATALGVYATPNRRTSPASQKPAERA